MALRYSYSRTSDKMVGRRYLRDADKAADADKALLPSAAETARRYPAFDVDEWKLRRCRRRVANMDMDAAFDRAQERITRRAERWADRYETSRKECKEMEDRAEESARRASGWTSRPHAAPTLSSEQLAIEKIETRLKKYAERSGAKGLTKVPFQTVDLTSSKDSGQEVGWRADANEQQFLKALSELHVSAAAPPTPEGRVGPKAEVLRPERAERQLDLRADASARLSKVAHSSQHHPRESKKSPALVRAAKSKPKCTHQVSICNISRSALHFPVEEAVPALPRVPCHSLEVKKKEPPRRKSIKTSAPMPNGLVLEKVNLRSTIRFKKDMSWLEHKVEDIVMIESMHASLEKWLAAVQVYEGGDPLDQVKGKAAGTVLVGSKSLDPYPRLKDAGQFSYKGEVNFFGQPHGKGVITYSNGDQFRGEFRNDQREGLGTLQTVEHEILYLDGKYVNDKLEGKARVQYRNGDVLHAWFSKGTLHGFGKLFDKDRHLKQVGWYSDGKASGLTWKFLVGGGCLIGEVDSNGHIAGTNVAFLFPDHQTALLGSFVDMQMLSAQTCFVQLVSVKNELCYLKFTQPRGPFYSFDAGTTDIICKEPLLQDPHETQYCYVRSSRIRGAQEGLFARKDLPKEFIVAFYNGTKMRSDELDDSDRHDWEAHAYKIMDLQGEDAYGTQGVLDIPPECVNTKNYVASLAHKANHSFEPSGKFVLFHHPRFGLLPAIKTIAEIPRDSEITVSYDYAMDDAPPWYQELFTKRIMQQYQESRMWNL